MYGMPTFYGVAFHTHLYHRVLVTIPQETNLRTPILRLRELRPKELSTRHGPASESRLSAPRLRCRPELPGTASLQVGAQCRGAPILCASFPASHPRSHHRLLPAPPAASPGTPTDIPPRSQRPGAGTRAASTPRGRKTAP